MHPSLHPPSEVALGIGGLPRSINMHRQPITALLAEARTNTIDRPRNKHCEPSPVRPRSKTSDDNSEGKERENLKARFWGACVIAKRALCVCTCEAKNQCKDFVFKARRSVVLQPDKKNVLLTCVKCVSSPGKLRSKPYLYKRFCGKSNHNSNGSQRHSI